MKNLSKKLIVLSLLVLSIINVSVARITPDTVLVNAQSKIEKAFVSSFKARNIEAFNTLERQFRVSQNNWKNYWLAYLTFYKSVYYLKTEDKATCEKAIKEGITQLEKSAQNSEELALLAYLQSFSVQFYKGMAAGFVSSKVKRNADKAISLDKNNLRAFYVLGSNDFYTPTTFGGGKKVEEYLTKAIRIPDKKPTDTTIPSWGKDSAYEMLIKYYIKQNKSDLAKKYLADAQKLYPKNYALVDLAKQIKS